MKRAVTSIVFAALALATGCGGDDGGGGSAAPAESQLTGIPWVQVGPGAVASVEFAAGGKLAGSGGCNRFGGTYEVAGTRLTVGALHSTQMACAPPVDAAERQFLAALERAEAWEVDGGQLVIAQSGGGEPLRFEAASPEGAWQATALRTPDAVTSVLKGTELTADFAADGSLTGSAGCNTYSATYTTDRDKIEIADVSATEKACDGPAGVMEQERQFLTALPQAASYRIEGQVLTLLTPEGTIAATFQEMPE